MVVRLCPNRLNEVLSELVTTGTLSLISGLLQCSVIVKKLNLGDFVEQKVRSKKAQNGKIEI